MVVILYLPPGIIATILYGSIFSDLFLFYEYLTLESSRIDGKTTNKVCHCNESDQVKHIIDLANSLEKLGHNLCAKYIRVTIHKIANTRPSKVIISSRKMDGNKGYILSIQPVMLDGSLGKEELINFFGNTSGSRLQSDRNPSTIIDGLWGAKNKKLSTSEVRLSLIDGMNHLDFKIPMK